MTKLDVVAAILERDRRYLFGKRSLRKPTAPGYWCPISGRVEAGELQSEAIEREVREETGLAVRAVEKVGECCTHDGSALIHWWRVEARDDAPARLANDEHSELAWVTLEEMKRLEPVFLEDVAIIERAARGSGDPVSVAYDRWAPDYDVEPNRTTVLAGEVLRRSGLERAGRRIIEAGCGTGRNTAWLADGAASVLGLDLSEGMLREAQRRVRAPHVGFQRHDIGAPWPVPARSAELVTAMLVFEHIEQLAPVFRQAARALVPGGALFVCELHPVRQMLGAGARFAAPGGVEHIPAHGHDVSDYVNAALDAGFVLERLGEHRDAGAPFEAPPRALSGLWRASA